MSVATGGCGVGAGGLGGCAEGLVGGGEGFRSFLEISERYSIAFVSPVFTSVF